MRLVNIALGLGLMALGQGSAAGQTPRPEPDDRRDSVRLEDLAWTDAERHL